MFKKIVAFSLFILFALIGFAQKATIKGIVHSFESGEGLPFANIVLEGTNIGTSTDVDGVFSLPNLTRGQYRLIVVYVGFKTDTTLVELEENKTVNLKIFLHESSTTLQNVTISAEKQDRTSQTKVSTITVVPKALKQLPTIGGEPDLAQYLAVIPGIVFTGDQGGQVYIRGGSAVNTLFLIDGMPVYNPFHSIGLFSVYETEIIKSAEVMTGGFGAEYGNRTSAVVNVTTRDGNKKKFSGLVSASPFMAKAVLEGPLWRYNQDKGNGSFILAGKYSYIDKTSSSIYPYVDGGSIPYRFTDIYGKLAFASKSGSKFNLFGFNFRDNASFNQIADYNWNAWGVGGNFVLVPNRGKLYMNTNLNYTKYILTLDDESKKQKYTSVGGFNIGMNFVYYLKKGDLKYGLEITGFKTEYEFYNVLGLKIDQNQNTTEFAAYAKYRKEVGKFVLEPGFRLQYYGSLAEISAEPRLRLKYNVHPKFRMKLSGGIYSQNLISTKSDRDIVNLFTGFLSGPDESLNDIDGTESKSKIQKSVHTILGFEYDPISSLEFNLEPYYIYNIRQININRNKLFASDPNYMIERGDAYGIDLSTKFDKGPYYLWLSYSLAWVHRNDGEQTYPPNFDRRHNFNLVAAYTFGKNKNWEVSTRFNLGSGFPFTRTAGFYEELYLNDGVATNVNGENGQLGILYEDKLNQGRLPVYHRWDLGLKKWWEFKKDLKLETNLSLTNVYNQKNIFYIDRATLSKVYQLPILPSLSVNFSF